MKSKNWGGKDYGKLNTQHRFNISLKFTLRIVQGSIPQLG